jgi:hypothetical protein
MVMHKSFTVEFKSTLCAAEQHFCAQGHSITKQTIHGWLWKHNEIYLTLDKKGCRYYGGGNRPALPPDVEDILKGIVLEIRQESNQVKS